MLRQLRERKSKPNYSALAGFRDDSEEEVDEAVPGELDDGDSGSDFALGKASGKTQDGDNDGDDNEEDEDMADGSEDEEDFAEPEDKPTRRRRGRSSATTSAKSGTRLSSAKKKVNGIASAMKRKMHAHPVPSVNHRHRAKPLYNYSGRVGRLTKHPKLFETPQLMLTNNFTHSKTVFNRVTRALGTNVGAGPLWELLEDRGWFKEGVDRETEEERRPLVYGNVPVKSSWNVISVDEAASYLPTDTVTTEDGSLKPAPPVSCYFGSYGDQKLVDVPMLASLRVDTAHVCNPGAPAWGLDWCPIHVNDRERRGYRQYLAMSPFPSRSHSPIIGTRVERPCHSCIQIWTLSKDDEDSDDDEGVMKCETVLCHESGPAHELRWCPLPSHDVDTDLDASASLPAGKLGLLAGTFEDGSFAIYVVPEPDNIRPEDYNSDEPIFVALGDPILRIELEETSCWSFDWANSEMIAIGTTSGIIAVYDLGPALKTFSDSEMPTITDLLPTHYLSIHQSAVRAVAWIRAPPSASEHSSDPTLLATGGFDGMECLVDLRDCGHGSVMNRTRDVINTMGYSSWTGGPIIIDHENIVKAYSASPSMLGRGHTVMDPKGPVWSVAVSDWHPQLAVGSADGALSTTNLMKSTRRGGMVPWFVHKIYQMDYSRKTGEFRMLDHFLPQEMSDMSTHAQSKRVKKPKSSKLPDPKERPTTGAWPHEVSVHKAVWNSASGPNAAGLLASATSSGLCRVDNLWGRWLKGVVPYGGVMNMRLEGDEDMDDEEEDGMDVDDDED